MSTRQKNPVAASTGATAGAADDDVVLDNPGYLTMIFLLRLAQRLSTDYRGLGIFLGLENYTITTIEADFPKVVERGFEILKTWKQTSVNPDSYLKYLELSKALSEVKREDLVDFVRLEAWKKRAQTSVAKDKLTEREQRLLEKIQHMEGDLDRLNRELMQATEAGRLDELKRKLEEETRAKKDNEQAIRELMETNQQIKQAKEENIKRLNDELKIAEDEKKDCESKSRKKIQQLTEEKEDLKKEVKSLERKINEVILRQPNASTKDKPQGQAKVTVDAALTAKQRSIVKAVAQPVEGESKMDRTRRKLEVMRLIVQYQDPHLWSDVNDVILEDGRLNLAGVFTREDIPNFVYIMKSGVAAEDITSINLGRYYNEDGYGFKDSPLDLSSVTDMEDICSCLSSLPRLKELWLDECGITDSAFAVLAKTLTTQCPKMTILVCYDNEMTSDVTADVEILLEKRKQLTIGLGVCRLSPETCRRLKEAFGRRVRVGIQKTK